MSTDKVHVALLVVVQIVFVVLFAIFCRYTDTADASHYINSLPSANREDDQLSDIYHMFQDVHIMIFIGFGFLMTFLKRYGLSSVSLNFLIAAMVLEWAILVNGFFHLHHGLIEIDITSLLGADFTAAAVLISFGVVLGKTTPSQLLVMALLEVPIFVINEVIGRKYIMAVDMGDSMFVHAFGAYFGMAVSFVLFRKDTDSPNQGSTKNSDLFSMIGTVFLWCFWPSFNSALAPGDDQHRAVINTYLSLVACCVAAFATSSLLHQQGKFTMEHIQNATLAGGVAIGTSADMMVQPYGALVIGTLAGAMSVVGYEKITPLLDRVCRIHDTCGVHNLHGLPGVLAGVIGAIMSSMASTEVYHSGLYSIFPAMAPLANSTELADIQQDSPHVTAGLGRSASSQGWHQMAALFVTLLLAAVGGVLTGLVMRMSPWQRLDSQDLFDDRRFFVIHDEEDEQQQHRQDGCHGNEKTTAPGTAAGDQPSPAATPRDQGHFNSVVSVGNNGM